MGVQEGKSLLGRLEEGGRITLKLVLYGIGWRLLDSYGSGWGLLKCSCGHGNVLSFSMSSSATDGF